jgi:hypothetical protein
VPTFRSSCSIAAPTFTNFGKSWALANLLNLVPLYLSEVPDRTRPLQCRDFQIGGTSGDQSLDAAGADGAKVVAGAGVRTGFGAGGFLAAATVGDAVGRGDVGEGVAADGAT